MQLVCRYTSFGLVAFALWFAARTAFGLGEIEEDLERPSICSKINRRTQLRQYEMALREFVLTGRGLEIPFEVLHPQVTQPTEDWWRRSMRQLKGETRQDVAFRYERGHRTSRDYDAAIAALSELRKLELLEDRLAQKMEGDTLGARQRHLLQTFIELDHLTDGHARKYANSLIRQLQDFTSVSEGELRITTQRVLDGYIAQTKLDAVVINILQQTTDNFTVAYVPRTVGQDFH